MRIISGGQSGADQGGLRAARSLGISTGGYAPLGWMTEDGPAPWLATFGLVEHDRPGYPPRTEANVRAADALIWFGDPASRGGRLTLSLCDRLAVPTIVVPEGGSVRPSSVGAFLLARGVAGTIMIAGNRESVSPGIGGRVEWFLARAFRRSIVG